MRKAFKAAELYDPELRPGLHALRRTWASQLLKLGADVETVKELGGWSSLAVMEHYLRSDEETKRRAIELLG